MQMNVEGVEVDPMALHTLLRALTAADQWKLTLHVFEQVCMSVTCPGPCPYPTTHPCPCPYPQVVESEQVQTSSVFAAALEACAVGAQRDKALELLQQMRGLGVAPSARCYHQVAASCAAADDWKSSLSVLQVRTWGLDCVNTPLHTSTYVCIYLQFDTMVRGHP